jgi:hypothetical protein
MDSMTLSLPEQNKERRLSCARCGSAFDCGAHTGHCWCADEAYRMPLPTTSDADCLCPACLRAAARLSGQSA